MIFKHWNCHRIRHSSQVRVETLFRRVVKRLQCFVASLFKTLFARFNQNQPRADSDKHMLTYVKKHMLTYVKKHMLEDMTKTFC